jgi:hydroxylaminobenzene mutase
MIVEPSTYGHHLIQIGIALLLVTSLQGFSIPAARVRRLALSAHTVGLFMAFLLLALGLIWPMLRFSQTLAAVTFWLLLYSVFGTWLPYVLGSFWGAGNSMLPLAAGAARGSAAQEGTIKVLLMTSALTTIATFALILWAL